MALAPVVQGAAAAGDVPVDALLREGSTPGSGTPEFGDRPAVTPAPHRPPLTRRACARLPSAVARVRTDGPLTRLTCADSSLLSLAAPVS